MDFPLINGHRFSWASISFDIDGSDIIHIKEISYTSSMETADVRGTGPQKAGTTRGEYNAEGSMTLLAEGWNELRARLGNGYMERRFRLIVSYAEVGQDVQTDELVGCRITSVEKGGSQGTDALEVSLELNITYILENGVQPLLGMRL